VKTIFYGLQNFRDNGTEWKEVKVKKLYSLASITDEEVFRETCVGQIFDIEGAIAPSFFDFGRNRLTKWHISCITLCNCSAIVELLLAYDYIL